MTSTRRSPPLRLQVFSQSERNYRVMRVKFYVGYSDSDEWPAPLNVLYFPFFLFEVLSRFKCQALLARCTTFLGSLARGLWSCLASCTSRFLQCCSSDPAYSEMDKGETPKEIARRSSARRRSTLAARYSPSDPQQVTIREDLDRCAHGQRVT